MKFTLKIPSLQQMTLVKISSELWNQDDIRDLITFYQFTRHHHREEKRWQKLEDKVLEKVTQLPSPKPLKAEVARIIRPIGQQIMQWWNYHNHNYNLVFELPEQFFWTPRGTIDWKRTGETLAMDMDIDVDTRYKLACINCLEDQIPELWLQMCEKKGYDFNYCGFQGYSRYVIVKRKRPSLVARKGQLQKMSEGQLQKMGKRQLQKMCKGQLQKMCEGQLEKMSEGQLQKMGERQLLKMCKGQLQKNCEGQLQKMSEGVSFVVQQINPLVTHWTKYMRCLVDLDDHEEDPSPARAFELASVDANRVGAEFFFWKLTREEKNKVLVARAMMVAYMLSDNVTSTHITNYKSLDLYIPQGYATETFHFLLKQMSEDQQVQLLLKRPHHVLRFFLEWPYQPLYMDLAKKIKVLQSIDPESIPLDFWHFTLRTIVEKIASGWMDFDYGQMFHDFWHLNPLVFERDATYKIDFWVLLKVLKVAEQEVIRLVFKEVTDWRKRVFVFFRGTIDACERFVDDGQWGSLRLLIEQCVPTKEDMITFKKVLVQRYSLRNEGHLERKRKWEKFSNLLDDYIQNKSDNE